jgi:hypothetical protein
MEEVRTMSETIETISAIAYGDAPVLETLAQMNLDTLDRSGLDERTYMMVRIAGLVAMDAPPVSYAINLGASADTLELEDLQGILVTLAPVVGSARIASAAASILDVFLVEDDEILDTDDDAEIEIVDTIDADDAANEDMAGAATDAEAEDDDSDEDVADENDDRIMVLVDDETVADADDDAEGDEPANEAAHALETV